MKTNNYFSVKFEDDNLIFLDQTKLSLEENYITTDDYERIAVAIERLEVRGAPLIGICAAYGLALSFKDYSGESSQRFEKVYKRLASTRPTAVNLFNCLDRMKEKFHQISDLENTYSKLLSEAKEIHNEDEEFCRKIGKNGLKIFKRKSKILTHCNTGKLATGGDGTAFNVIKTGFENGLVEHVYADETRPLLQGSRLTAYELDKSEIPFTLQTDNSAALLFAQNKIDFVVTGADRIALNGDSANKIGTFNLAVLCNFHNIPFYIAAPSTTIDRNIADGKEIEIEYRSSEEVLKINDLQISSDHYKTFTPAFDVTPAHLISGIITEEGVFFFPYNFIK